MFLDKLELLFDRKDWVKILLISFFTALFLFVFQLIFSPQAGRYHLLKIGDSSFILLDTATGKVYRQNGKLYSVPQTSNTVPAGV